MSSPLPPLPQITVQAGLTPDAPGQGGTALFLGTGPGLDTATLGTDPGWTDISQFVLGFTVTRPGTRLQGPLWNFQAGTASITLDNSDGRFDPDNLAGPYVSGGVTQLAAMVPVRILASWAVSYPLFSGFADGWLPAQVTYEGGYAELVLPATDAFKVLAGITLPAITLEGAGNFTGTRITDILTRAGWYTSAERNVIAAGNSQLQGTTLGSDALSLMQLATDSEVGQLYVSGGGAVVFRNRQALATDTRSSTPQAVFGDLPALVTQSYDTAVAADAPSAWWKLADAAGSASAADSSGNGHAGTPANVTFGAAGPLIMTAAETAAGFGGTSSKVDTAYNPAGLTALSLEAWVNLQGVTPASSSRILADSHTDVDNAGFQLYLDTLHPKVNLGNGTSAVTVFAAPVPVTGWHHIAATWDGASILLYVDGALAAGPAAFTGPVTAGTANTGIGYNPVYAGDWLNGTLGQVAVYAGTALPASRVLAHYQAAHAELAYAAIARAADDTTIGNDIQATIAGSSSMQEAKNTASIAKYLFPRSYARSDLILLSDSDAANWANYVLYVAASGEDRIESLAVDPLADPANLWPQVLGREIGDRVQVWTRPAGVATPVTRDCFITGITHVFDAALSTWLTTWTFADASKYGSFLTLDNATLGQLGFNALSF